MAKYIANINGNLTETTGLETSAGAGDAAKIVQTNSAGKIDSSLLPSGVGQSSRLYTAFEAISAGDFVNIFSDSGTPKIRKADATGPPKKAHGYVLAAIASNASGLVYFDDIDSGLSGLTPGADCFLSDVNPGKTMATSPSGAGKICQKVGYALSTTEIQATISEPIQLSA